MNHIHIIGICGKGTSSLALILKQQGHHVTGSDSGSFEPINTTLRTHGIDFTVGYSHNNIPQEADAFVIGSSAQLSIETNEEVKAAHETKKPIFSFAEFLHTLTQDTFNIVIAGSYGKSTCTSLATHIIRESGKDPSYFIGAEPIGFQSAHSGKDPLFILEGDEYPHDTASLTPKFAFYNPKTVLLTSAAHDHINKFSTLESYLETYTILLEKTKPGIIVTAIEHPHVKELTENYPNLVTYGLTQGTYTAQNIVRDSISQFELCKNNTPIATIQTQLLGEHSIENIVGVSTLLLENNIVSIEDIQKAVPTFQGVTKRLELHNPHKAIPVYESYGSSFEKARADIQAIQNYLPHKKMILLFEPHTFGWRNRGNIDWYNSIFQNIDHVVIYKPFSAGSASHDQLQLHEIVERVSQTNPHISAVDDSQELLSTLIKNTPKDAVVLLMTSSNFDGALESIISHFQQ